MRRIVLWAAVTVTVFVLLFSYRTSTSAVSASAAIAPDTTRSTTSAGSGSTGSGSSSTSSGSSGSGSTDSGSSSGTAAGSSDSSSSSGTSGSSSSSGTSSSTASGTYTGDAVDTRWGPVQVQITVKDGKVTAAEAVVYPQENGRDQEINAVAIPALNQEVVTAQSANIDMISGATVTSDGYISSLQSALDQAHLS
ncbi:FMN-binding protein [Tersicoccus sp. Bi-70]|uniref:FMN-binding protein n=1 Tax=Tersicoccus sp. Bi-70 TaxID=1897634 RepID=UPI0009761B5F|nr:FMN-binding protein [Tersicoccus sp. Bi-70]OMH37006.1 FMN-binding protein [Tersicoccus sp. Bi-70]